MGKIHCTECGHELDDKVKFCSNCGTKTDNNTITSYTNENTEHNASKEDSIIKNTSKKTKNDTKSNNNKILAIAGVCIILIILGIILIGSSINNDPDDTTINEDNSDTPFIETIYGIDFSIPGYFKNVETRDYEDDGTGMISCTRTYERPDGTGIAIVVSTSSDGWNLDNDPTAMDMTINGHHGKLTSTRDVFGYVSGDKLVTISGTSQEEIEDIIIE